MGSAVFRALRGRSAPGVIHTESRMSTRLCPHVLNRPPQVSDAERAEVVAFSPPQPSARHHAVAVSDARTRTLQSLNESRDVHVGRELENHVHMVAHDPEIH